MIPTEVISMFGGAVTGFLFKYMSLRAKERQEQFKMYLQKNEASDKSADAAAARSADEHGKWVRRFIVISVMCAVVFGPFLAPILGIPVVVETKKEATDVFFNLIHLREKFEYVHLTGFLMISEIRHILSAISGFYFGNAAAK